MKTASRLGLALLLVVALCDVGLRWQNRTIESALASSTQVADQPALCHQLRVVQQGLIPMPDGVPVAHASNLVAFKSGHPLFDQKLLAAFWFAGTRESAPDVQIAFSTFDRTSQKWDAPQWVVNRQTLGEALGIRVRRLGNPMVWVDSKGRLHLFVVATGLGGWAASRVVHLKEDTLNNLSMQFKVVRTLPLTALVPAFNTSSLVRSAPLSLPDGGAVLPLYFEIGIKYGVAVRLNARGEMQGLTRITQRRDVLQPSLLAHSSSHWSAYMRDYGITERIAHSETQDGGQTWQDQPNLEISNPDTSLASLRLSNGTVVMAHNMADRRREVLYLSTALDDDKNALGFKTQPWVVGQSGDEFSYPSLIEATQQPKRISAQPELWLSYTHKRQAIAFQRLQMVCDENQIATSSHKIGGQP